MKQSSLSLWFAALPCALLVVGCASVSVRDVAQGDTSKPTQKPAHIYVRPFAIEPGAITENASQRARNPLGPETQRILAERIATELSTSVAPASVLAPNEAPRGPGWLVTGHITRLKEGNRLLRMSVGLGLGGTKLETSVQVRNVPGQGAPFLHFGTTGGSNAEPGAATSPIPFSAAPVALVQSQKGVSTDANRTARMISGAIGEYIVERGWMPPSPQRQAKHLHQ